MDLGWIEEGQFTLKIADLGYKRKKKPKMVITADSVKHYKIE